MIFHHISQLMLATLIQRCDKKSIHFSFSFFNLNHACLIILSYIAVYNRDTYARISSASVSSVDTYVICCVKNKAACVWKLQYGNSFTRIMANNEVSIQQTALMQLKMTHQTP